MLREERLLKNIQLWRFAASVPFPVSNIKRIEDGLTEPRIGIAMRMLAALDVDAGSFMKNLALSQNWTNYAIPDGASGSLDMFSAKDLAVQGDTLRCFSKVLFGELFRRLRLACGITQAVVA